MKKRLFFFAMLASVAASAQTGITVTPISTDYANQTVRFSVSWANGSRDATHNSKVWVFIDYRTVTNNVPSGSWARALISGTPTATSGTPSRETGNDKGFWLQGTSGSSGTYNATVTVKLSGVPAKFNWCAYATDYPPNATINNGTYTLKGTPPFTINTSITENNKTYSGGCITSLTDATGCPGIINHAFSAGTINSSSTLVRTGVTPAAITSNTNASSGGGFTYRWVRTGTSNATYTDNTAGHSFVAAEVSSAGTWTYYREVRDNTCNTTTWSRSSGSYKLTVIACPYTGSDLYIDATHLCRQRPSGAQNWEAWIKDTRDNKFYRIVYMPDNNWWLAQNVKLATYNSATVGAAISGCTEDECGRSYSWAQAYGSYGGTSGSSGNVQGICPNGWLLPVQATYKNMISPIGNATAITAALRSYNSHCSPIDDTYGWASLIGLQNLGTSTNISNYYTNDAGREDGFLLDWQYPSGHVCGRLQTDDEGETSSCAAVRCYRTL